MPPPSHPRTRPAARSGAGSRLPWWALVPPAVLFAVLLALILHPSDARAAAGDPAISPLIEYLRHLIRR